MQNNLFNFWRFFSDFQEALEKAEFYCYYGITRI